MIPPMQGDPKRPVRVRIQGGKEWVEGCVILISENDKSLALQFDEGISMRDAGLLPPDYKQVLLLIWMDEHERYEAMLTGAVYEVEILTPLP